MHEKLKLKYKILILIPLMMHFGGYVFTMPSLRLFFEVKNVLKDVLAFQGGDLIFYFVMMPFFLFFMPVLLAFCGFVFVYYFYKNGSDVGFLECYKLLGDKVYPDTWMKDSGRSENKRDE